MPKGMEGFQKGNQLGKLQKGHPYYPRKKPFHQTAEVKEKLRLFHIGMKYSDETNKKKGSPREKNPNWKGGEFTSKKGYVYILMPNHPNVNTTLYYKRANLVMEKIIGRHLKKGEIVHHINGITGDDSPENLMLFPNHSEHRKYEGICSHLKK